MENAREKWAMLSSEIASSGVEAHIDFEGAGGASDIQIQSHPRGQLPNRTLALLACFSLELIKAEISDWDQGEGSTGRIRVDGKTEPWMDADDRNDDWSIERAIDMDVIFEALGDPADPIPQM